MTHAARSWLTPAPGAGRSELDDDAGVPVGVLEPSGAFLILSQSGRTARR